MLRWLEYLAAGLAVIWLLSAFFNDQVVFGGVVLFVLFIGFFGLDSYFNPDPQSAPVAEVGGAEISRMEFDELLARQSRQRAFKRRRALVRWSAAAAAIAGHFVDVRTFR